MTPKQRKKAKKTRKNENRKMLKAKGMNCHHVNPRSISKDDSEQNTVYIDARRHEVYHWLFRNKTPDEIINYLIDYFWKGQTEWVFEAIAKRRLPDELPEEIKRVFI
jgi:alpha-glucosidase (family GH31 glycosyl hydrolase)